MKTWGMTFAAKFSAAAFVLALAGTFIFAAGSAYATTITLNEVGVNNAAVVNGTFGSPINGTYNVLAGYYQLQINGASPVNGFCVDPAWAPSTPQTYDLRAINSNSVYAKAAYLFSQSNAGNAAAVQVAIWKTVMGEDFVWNYPNSALSSTVSGLLNSLNDIPGTFNLSQYSLAVSPGDSPTGYGLGWQDYIVRSTAPVPEPATMLLLGSGLAGLAAFRKKSRK